MLTALVTICINHIFIGKEIVALQKDIQYIKEDVTEMSSMSTEMYNDIYLNGGIQTQVDKINEMLGIKPIGATDNTVSFLEDISIETNEISYTTSALSSEMVVGTDSDGNQYIAEDLVGQTVLLTYKVNGNNVYFLGQFNENYNWDGYCVVNEYDSNGNLVGICESNFDNGVRLDYVTVLYDKENIWDYYNRTCEDGYNSGESITYYLESNVVSNFTNTNVRVSDILYADKFLENANPRMLKYYYGNTSDQLFNDSTGEAYFVKYSEDGYVKTLYCGGFVNGQFEDMSGDAWYIVKEDDTTYMYYKGQFKGGYPAKDSESVFENYLSKDRILELVPDMEFNCEIEWEN